MNSFVAFLKRGIMNKKVVILDTDPGIDDAVALAYLLSAKTVDVKLITTVSGNVGIDNVTNNVLRLLSFYDKKIPVAKGATQPLVRHSESASDVHGESGMAGFSYEHKFEDCLLEEHAITAMYRTIMASDKKVTLVAIGPLTNIALLLRTYPDCVDHIEELIFMGGAIGRGNYGVYTEFNIGFDPEAADVVFKSPIKKVMVPLEMGDKAVIRNELKPTIRQINDIGAMFIDLFEAYRGDWVRQDTEMYDSTAIAYLLKPELYTTQDVYAQIELQGALTQGATVCDMNGILKQQPNITVCVDVDSQGFSEWFVNSIKYMR